MNRRQFLTAAAGASTLAAAQPKPAARNLLLLAVDDMNDWVGCLGGYPGVHTPNIDRLARRGVLFSDAHCASPLCNPSRTALLTGRAASTTGIYDNEQYWRPNLPGVVTMPEYFRANGYRVAGAGKIFHHNAGFNPPDQWDEFQLQEFDDPWYRRAEWYPWVKRIPNPEGHPYNGLKNFQGEFDWGILPKEEREYGDQRAVDFGASFLTRKHDKPFFLAIGLWHPHIPMFSPRRFYDLYPPEKIRMPQAVPGDLDDLPPVGRELAAFRREEHERIVKEGKWRDGVRSYLAAISFADAMIGRMLDSLDASPHARDTAIVFFSDNGWHLGEKEHWHKSTLWQRSTHVPLIISAPGVKKGPRRQPVTLLDLYPTVTDLCGLPRNTGLDGETLLPLLRDPKSPRKPAVSTYLAGNHAVITERWRYIRYHDGGEELYDRNADRNDLHNLAGDPKHTALKTELARHMPATSAPSKPPRAQFDFDFKTHTYRRK